MPRVARLSQQESGVGPPTAWWKRIVGVFQDDPEFEEAMRLGRAYRESLRLKLDWDVWLEAPPRPERTFLARFEYGGRDRPIAVDDPEASQGWAP